MNNKELLATKIEGDYKSLLKNCSCYNRKLNKLQSNWNNLREWLEKQKEDSKICKEWNNKKGLNDIDYERDIKRFDFVLDKMNELEGKDKE